MDPVSHLLVTRKLVGDSPRAMLFGLGPDAAFYLTYPIWVILRGDAGEALRSNQWPEPPRWILNLHRASHSLPVALLLAAISHVRTGRWPTRELGSWGLHVLLDVPTHERDPWGPRPLWPFWNWVFDGISWAKLILSAQRKLLGQYSPSSENSV